MGRRSGILAILTVMLLAGPAFSQNPSPTAGGQAAGPSSGLPGANQTIPAAPGGAPAATASPLKVVPMAPPAGMVLAPKPTPPAGNPFELVLDNFATEAVKAYVDGGLKCTLPTRYHCVLWVPDKSPHSVHMVRSDGFTYDDKFQFPIVLSGKAHDGAAYIITDQNVRIELKPSAVAK
ncbi:MAG TPA: hypothetical protein VJN94_13165 [Candidatus Binataceae bacterium]|nr:hypothetical protein [Candidatus Binataceae bacterium]